MKLFVAVGAIATPTLAGQCSSACTAEVLQSNIVNTGSSDDWFVQCNTKKTPDVNDESTSKKKDVYDIVCQGVTIGTYEFQKRKAAAKCAQPELTISCPDDCFGCDPAVMAGFTTNENAGPFLPVGAECLGAINTKKANWNIFCDANGNGVRDDDELTQTVIGKKNCKAIVNMEKSPWTLNCGTGPQISACGMELAAVQSQITNINQGNQYPVLIECTKQLSLKRSKWRFTCDVNSNGVADEGESSFTQWVLKGDFSGINVNCGDLDNCLGCLDSNIKITNTNKNNPGDILISCGKTLSAEQASIKFTCDHNANGREDEGELELLKTFTLNADGTCSRKNKPMMNCRENDVITTTSTTTTTTMPPTTTHTELCMGCLQIGGLNPDGGENLPIEDLITNINADPVPVLVRCKGMENDKPESTNGRAILNTFCDYNNDGIPQETEFHTELIIKNRNQGFCEMVAPSLWAQVDCGNAVCPINRCDADFMMSLEDKFFAFEGKQIKAECLGVNTASKDNWRFWCDDNNNGVWDDNEKFVETSPDKTLFEMNEERFPNGLYNCVPEVNLQCGIPADGSCMAMGAGRCTRELIVGQKPMIDFYKRREKIINFNWEYIYAEPGYTGKIDGYCNSFHENWRTENWTVYCDDNSNGVHDEDEISVTFETKWDYEAKGSDPNNFKMMIKHCPYYEIEEQLHCGYKKKFVEEFLKEAEDYENRGLQKKAQKECGYIYMGPQFYGSPTKDEWDGETCTSNFMQNALWANGTSPGYQTNNGGKMAGNILVGGSGLIQQGLGRDHPFALPVINGQSNWPKKGITDMYGMHSVGMYNAYIPCWEQIMEVGGERSSTYQYNQMYSLSKGERLFGWDTLNLMNEVQESYMFHLMAVEPFGGFFYDISPIAKQLFWKRWDLRRMGAINDFTDRLWRDHKWETHEDVLNTNEVDSINQVGVKVFMGFEGQLGALPQWLDRNFTKFNERPWMANTLKAHKDGDIRSAITQSSFSYGNKNYQNIAMMNSVTTAQADAWEAANPDTPYLERVFELYKNSYVGKWTIHHQQTVYDNANEDNEDGFEDNFDASGKYPHIDLATLFSRPELQECPGAVEEWASWSNCDRSCGEGIRIRTRGCFDADGNELGAGWCSENEREIQMCNLGKCDTSIWEAGQKWSAWGPWSTCNADNMNTRNRICNFESGECTGLHESPSPAESDYEAVFDESCIALPAKNVCNRIKMVTQYEHRCPHTTDDLKQGFDGTETYNGHPGCPDAPWWWHYRQFFRITGYYDLEEIVDGRPVFTKRAHDIKLKYNSDAESWVITNEGVNQLFVVSNAISPAHTNGADWNIRFEKDGYERFIPVWKAAQEPFNAKVEFEFECVEGEGFPVDDTLPQATGAQWTGWAEKYKYINSPEDGIVTCSDGCGDMRTKERARICSVEDLCVGTTMDTKLCGGNRPDTCSRQHGECDADGFRAIYWQHMANEGFSNDFKDACYNDHSKCQFGHNPPIKSKNFMNLVNLEQFKQEDDSTGFYEFKFEWDERPDEIELFEFESGPSDFSWKQRESPLDVEDQALEVWDITGQNVKNLTDFRFDGLAWSNNKDLSVMFDGIIDLGVEWVNGMGKQSRNTNWDPLWNIKQPLKRNWNLYSMGTLADRKFWWSKFMGGWVSTSEVLDNAHTNEAGQVIMLGRDMQEILFRSPLKSILKVRDINC